MYKYKYIKYKNKYFELKKLIGGGTNIPLGLLLDNPKFDFIFSGSSHIDKTTISNIVLLNYI